MIATRTLLLACLLTLLQPVLGALAAPPTMAKPSEAGDRETRPNILFLLADDLGWNDVGYHGGPYDTPHIDALAKAGLRLDQHYVQPTCSPTRAELLTGRYASRTGLVSPTNRHAFERGQMTLASHLRRAGYFTAIAGKWHLGSKPAWGPTQFGFDQSYGALAGGLDPYDHKYRRRSPNWYRNDEPLREEGHATDLIARQAVAWIEQESDRPFFIFVPFTAIHTPIREPEEYVARYEDRFQDEKKRLYGATVTHLDDAVGQILEALERTGQLENTVIVFTSDNGGVLPSDNRPLRGEKGLATEGGIRVPTIVRWNGHIEAGLQRTPVAVIDWKPTLLRIASIPTPAGEEYDGIDIGPLLTGHEADPAPRTLYWRSFYGSAVRRGRWKFVTWPGNPPALYDIESDPTESKNLAKDRPELAEELRLLLEQKEAQEPPPRRET